MNEETSLVPTRSIPTDPAERMQGEPSQPARHPLNQVHRLLRGRYLWAVLLALLLGAGGAVGGYSLDTPMFESSGLIEVKPSLPRLLYQSEQNSPMGWFDQFVRSEVRKVSSREVISSAMKQRSWMTLGFETTPDAVVEFATNLKAEHPPRTNHIVVTFRHADQGAAQAGVNSVIEAYMEKYGNKDGAEDEKTLETLRKLQSEWQDELALKNSQLLSHAEDLGAEAVEDRYLFLVQELNKLEEATNLARLELAMFGEPIGEEEDGEKKDGEQKERAVISEAEIALRDPQMRAYLGKRRELMLLIDRLDDELGENNDQLIAVRDQLSLLDQTIEDYARIYREVNGPAPTSHAALREAAEARVTLLESRLKKAKQDAKDVFGKYRKLESLREEKDLLADRLAEVGRRINEVEVEGQVHGRITVAQRGFRPYKPLKDKRMQLAVLGGLAEFGLGFFLIMLRGAFDSRVRDAEDLEVRLSGVPVLGLLPHLPKDLSDPEEVLIAAHCVHQVRTLLQIHGHRGVGQSFCITSPAARTGKTTLTVALGLSFSSSRSRTLLIDCDLVGRALSSRANSLIARRIERLISNGSPGSGDEPDSHVRDALADLLASTVGPVQRRGTEELWSLLERAVTALGIRRVKEEGILSQIDFLARQVPGAGEDEHWQNLVSELGLDDGGSAESRNGVGAGGLSAVLAGADLEECVVATGVPDLYVLPLGRIDDGSANMLSPIALSRLFDLATSKFDTVLVDTGPTPGSLEASMVATQVGGVVLTVSRGEDRPLAEKAMSFLLSIGARPIGLVLNRADAAEVKRSRSVAVSQLSRRDQS